MGTGALVQVRPLVKTADELAKRCSAAGHLLKTRVLVRRVPGQQSQECWQLHQLSDTDLRSPELLSSPYQK